MAWFDRGLLSLFPPLEELQAAYPSLSVSRGPLRKCPSRGSSLQAARLSVWAILFNIRGAAGKAKPEAVPGAACLRGAAWAHHHWAPSWKVPSCFSSWWRNGDAAQLWVRSSARRSDRDRSSNAVPRSEFATVLTCVTAGRSLHFSHTFAFDH